MKKSRTVGRPRTASSPNPVDIHVGNRIRQRRTLLGMSQEKLGDALGVTFQQVQKYERGANRVGSARLYDLSRALKVPVAYFFEEVLVRPPGQTPMMGLSDHRQADFDIDLMSQRETLELVRGYYSITDPAQRRKVFDLIRTMAKIKRAYHRQTDDDDEAGEILPLNKPRKRRKQPI